MVVSHVRRELLRPSHQAQGPEALQMDALVASVEVHGNKVLRRSEVEEAAAGLDHLHHKLLRHIQHILDQHKALQLPERHRKDLSNLRGATFWVRHDVCGLAHQLIVPPRSHRPPR